MKLKTKLLALFRNKEVSDDWEQVLRIDALRHAELADAAYTAAMAHPIPDSPVAQGHYSRYAKHTKELRTIMKLLRTTLKPKRKEVKDYFTNTEANAKSKRKLRKIQIAR